MTLSQDQSIADVHVQTVKQLYEQEHTQAESRQQEN